MNDFSMSAHAKGTQILADPCRDKDIASAVAERQRLGLPGMLCKPECRAGA